MTKEDLYSVLLIPDGDKPILLAYIEQQLDDFFDSNICIPKGENCHPYHMELHQWAENPLIDLQVFNDTNGAFTLSIMDEYHIKPSEPVYEYLWYNANGDTKWMTRNEAKEFERTWFWAKETSRMRQ